MEPTGAVLPNSCALGNICLLPLGLNEHCSSSHDTDVQSAGGFSLKFVLVIEVCTGNLGSFFFLKSAVSFNAVESVLYLMELSCSKYFEMLFLLHSLTPLLQRYQIPL